MVFPTPLLISIKLFQVSQTSQDACRIDGEYLLSSLLVWSGHPPPISYSRHTKHSKYIWWFNLKILDSIWQYLNSGMGAMWVTVAPLPPIFLLHHYILPLPLFASPLHSYHVLYIYTHSQSFCTPFLTHEIHPECLILLFFLIFIVFMVLMDAFACISALFYLYIIKHLE